MNKKRQRIWDKSGGLCFYCGCELPEKGWHADHFHPIIRRLEFNKGTITTGKECAHPHLDTEDNLVPSCAPCNNFKHSLSIEQYRQSIEDQFENVQKYSTGARQLVRMGLLDFSKKPVVFWFERNGIKMPSQNEAHGISEEADSIEWKFDNKEWCYHSNINDRIVTVKSANEGWLVVATDYEWNQDRVMLGHIGDINAKKKAAQWALEL